MFRVPRGVLASVGAAGLMSVAVVIGSGQQPAPAPPALRFVPIHPIEPPARALAGESESANVRRFSFFAYGDTRSAGTPAAAAPVPGAGDIVNPARVGVTTYEPGARFVKENAPFVSAVVERVAAPDRATTDPLPSAAGVTAPLSVQVGAGAPIGVAMSAWISVALSARL